VVIEVDDRVVQLGPVVGHLAVERLDAVQLDEPDARLGERQRQAAPVITDLCADGGDGPEARCSRVD
jgi:hypothetical protein